MIATPELDLGPWVLLIYAPVAIVILAAVGAFLMLVRAAGRVRESNPPVERRDDFYGHGGKGVDHVRRRGDLERDAALVEPADADD